MLVRERMKTNITLRPFGIQFLETVPEPALDQVSGGRKHPGGVVTTEAISAPVKIGRHRFGKPDRF